MKRVLLTGAAALAACSGAATANPVAQSAQFDGAYTIDLQGQVIGTPESGDVIAYSNRSGTANAGFANPDLTATYGDALTLEATGTLQQVSFAVFNGNGTTGAAMTGASVNIDFFRDSDGSFIGGFGVNLSGLLGTNPLVPGSFREFTVPNLGTLEIDIDTTDVIMLQTFSNVADATAVGVVSRVPPSVGSAVPQLYIDAAGVGSGPGFFNIVDANQQPLVFNMIAEVVVPSPAGASLLAMAGLVGLRRRR